MLKSTGQRIMKGGDCGGIIIMPGYIYISIYSIRQKRY